MSEGPDFGQLVDFSNWKSFDEFVVEGGSQLDQDIENSIKVRRELRQIIRGSPQVQQRIHPKTDELSKWHDLLKWAETKLFGGDVVAVDGTMSRFQLASGTRCRIGVVATTYRNNRIEKILFVSERNFAEAANNPVEHIQKIQKQRRTSNILFNAVMGYGERKLLLQRPQEWKLLQGELLPFELRTGLGKLKALNRSLELGKKLIEAKKVIAVTEDTQWLNLLHAGYALERGQFMEAPMDMKQELEVYLKGDEDIEPAHFSTTDKDTFQSFIDEYASQMKMGIYRTGYKPYVYYAHMDFFDEATAIIMSDSALQPIRGYPQLIDYANNIAKGVLSQSDFQRQIMSRIAMIDPEELGFEISARLTRRE